MTTIDDLSELRELQEIASRPAIKAFLGSEIERLSAAVAAPPHVAATASNSPAAAATAAAAAVPAVSTAPRPVSVTSSVSEPAAVFYEPLRYGFSTEGDNVEVTVLDAVGVGALPRENISVEFGTQSFDLRIHGLGGKNYRLKIPLLEKEINPEASSYTVGKNRVTLRLKKQSSWDYWGDALASKKKAPSKAAGAKPDDPMSGIMDVMKDMYDQGDDATKKMIAESWQKSREQQQGGGRGGMGGGFGGLGAGGDGGFDDGLGDM